jgi:hypothetical protein
MLLLLFVVVFWLHIGPQAPSSALPIGAERKVDPAALVECEPSPTMLNNVCLFVCLFVYLLLLLLFLLLLLLFVIENDQILLLVHFVVVVRLVLYRLPASLIKLLILQLPVLFTSKYVVIFLARPVHFSYTYMFYHY